jgi:hypothetical protein
MLLSRTLPVGTAREPLGCRFLVGRCLAATKKLATQRLLFAVPFPQSFASIPCFMLKTLSVTRICM